ncbi:isonitrile hydratase, ThiJ/PfpI family protein [Mycolicibacterium canariasense]|uniref:Isonitrile hydratase, ThiJ/PfpI family protein n=1 Tax=Mycolicibacterium canariasense TaxID=228230 RepID=A0A117IBA0_MYCCR|nr:DJ-1/PfpI family protein [Mycolicibacterium canariasense]ORU99488.1 hypothetical protein AWB94_01110 [Mycolicibacterium canariasense]GAS97565.1 isonitrile hydratase, ThiJ/PfpI family protein [Mycolicibacterium canariasense]
MAAGGHDETVTQTAIVLRARRTATWTASVCSGSIILAASGVLDGKRATSHWAALPVLKTFGVEPVGDERIVHQGDVVTCAGVSAGIDLGLWLAALMWRELLKPAALKAGTLLLWDQAIKKVRARK